MLKKTAITMGICAIAIASSMGSASAGSGQHNFRFFKSFHAKPFHFDRQRRSHFRSCWRFKRKFHRTGKRFWLKKYHACRIWNGRRW